MHIIGSNLLDLLFRIYINTLRRKETLGDPFLLIIFLGFHKLKQSSILVTFSSFCESDIICISDNINNALHLHFK